MEDKLKLFGTDWCLKTTALKNYLQSEWVDFEYYNVEEDENAKEEVMAFYDGKLKFPTMSRGSKHWKNPSIPEVRALLKEE